MYKLYIEKNTSTKELLKKVMQELNINDEIIFNDNGKPYFKNSSFYFNISHSGNYIVLAISDKEIGVDIEKIKMNEKVAKKICTESELKQIKTKDDFTKIWVMKESYVKYLGIGLSYGLKNVDTTKIKNFDIKKIEDYYICVYNGE